MALEPDQTKWVGIRPTDPPETIPVSMAAAPPCAKVEPCAANTAFNTLTRKLAPAVGDLQAIKDVISDYAAHNNIDTTVQVYKSFGAVPAGELYVVTSAAAANLTSLCDIEIMGFIDGRVRNLKGDYSLEPDNYSVWNGLCVLKEDDLMIYNFLLGGANDTLIIRFNGYSVGIY